jgi:uncharacterized membrane protein
MDSQDDKASSERDEIPRQSLLAAMPKRTFVRVLVLIAALIGIVYLRERTSSIAGCMSSAFRVLPPPARESSTSPVRARIELRMDASTKSLQ